jgi:hypothetical protein
MFDGGGERQKRREAEGPRTYPLQRHVARNLKHDNPHKHQLIAKVDGVEGHVNVGRESTRQGAAYVHAVELEDQEAQEEQR